MFMREFQNTVEILGTFTQIDDERRPRLKRKRRPINIPPSLSISQALRSRLTQSARPHTEYQMLLTLCSMVN
jgi:hypothetical protein